LNYLLFILLTFFAAFSRLAPHPPNFTPILSIALFCGISFRSKYIFLIPLFSMLISDYFIGYHSMIMYVYVSLLIIFFIGKYLIKENSFNSTMVLSLSSAIIFFIISNFGVWIVGYPKNISGFIACYVAALPFLSNTLISTLLFSSVFHYCQSFNVKERGFLHNR
tara:strand:+ start:3153 stop:3647 length:495 start_codon:yes stop_codon:yes gene_type:complete